MRLCLAGGISRLVASERSQIEPLPKLVRSLPREQNIPIEIGEVKVERVLPAGKRRGDIGDLLAVVNTGGEGGQNLRRNRAQCVVERLAQLAAGDGIPAIERSDDASAGDRLDGRPSPVVFRDLL